MSMFYIYLNNYGNEGIIRECGSEPSFESAKRIADLFIGLEYYFEQYDCQQDKEGLTPKEMDTLYDTFDNRKNDFPYITTVLNDDKWQGRQVYCNRRIFNKYRVKGRSDIAYIPTELSAYPHELYVVDLNRTYSNKYKKQDQLIQEVEQLFSSIRSPNPTQMWINEYLHKKQYFEPIKL